MAFSSRMASFVASASKVLIALSPKAPSIRRPKPPAKPLTPTKPTPSISDGRSVQEMHARLLDDRGHLLDAAALVIVVAEHGDDWDRAGVQVFGQKFGLARLAEVGEVAGEHQNVSLPGDVSEQVAVGNRMVLRHVQVAHGGDPEHAVATHRASPPPRRHPRSPTP